MFYNNALPSQTTQDALNRHAPSVFRYADRIRKWPLNSSFFILNNRLSVDLTVCFVQLHLPVLKNIFTVNQTLQRIYIHIVENDHFLLVK